jgi:uncharacterized protein YfiM (DUF2279 family)
MNRTEKLLKNQTTDIIKTFFLFTLIIFSTCALKGQSKDSINHQRLNTVILTGGVLYTGTMIGLNSVWYSQYDKQSFQFFNDWPEWNQTDKLGHVYSSFQLSSMSSRALQWSGVSKRKSDISGAITSFAIMSSIEILDGYSAGYGASASDWVANAVGSGFFLGQNLLWNEVRIYPKYSFHRTDFAPQRPGTLGNGLLEEMIKDYNGQTIWLSMDVDKFINFPKWLNIAVGYGTESMIYATYDQNIEQGLYPYRQLYLSLDFDLTAIKSRSKLVNTLIYFANMIKLPAPAIEFSQGKPKGYLFYY